MTTDVLKLPGDYVVDAKNGNITLNVSTTGHTGSLVLNGNLQVIGNSGQVDALTLSIRDNIITLNSGETNTTVSQGVAGIRVARGFDNSDSNSATFLFNDTVAWSDGVNTTHGIFEFSVAQQTSAIRTDAIRVSTASTSLNLLGADNPNAVVSVKGTIGYENRVVDDDDIPNKRYVDLQVASGSASRRQSIIFGIIF